MGRIDQRRTDRGGGRVKRKNGSRRPSERLGKDRQDPGAGVCNEKIGTWAPEEYPREIYRWRERRI